MVVVSSFKVGGAQAYVSFVCFVVRSCYGGLVYDVCCQAVSIHRAVVGPSTVTGSVSGVVLVSLGGGEQAFIV